MSPQKKNTLLGIARQGRVFETLKSVQVKSTQRWFSRVNWRIKKSPQRGAQNQMSLTFFTAFCPRLKTGDFHPDMLV